MKKLTQEKKTEYIERARAAGCKCLLITYEEGDAECYPYHVAKDEAVCLVIKQLKDEDVEVIEEIFLC